MAEMSLPTIVEGNGGFGGAGMGAGFIGGLVLGSLWNGNGFGFGGNAGMAAAAAAGNGNLANAVEHVSDQVTQGTLTALQQAQNSNMFMGNLINSAGDAITGAINQGTVTNLQSTANIAEKLCGVEKSIITQGYESRLMGQELTARVSAGQADLSRQIFEEGCKSRELQREIATQATRDKLAEAQAKNAALEAQINLQGQLQAQTLYLISQLKTGTTTTTTP